MECCISILLLLLLLLLQLLQRGCNRSSKRNSRGRR